MERKHWFTQDSYKILQLQVENLPNIPVPDCLRPSLVFDIYQFKISIFKAHTTQFDLTDNALIW